MKKLRLTALAIIALTTAGASAGAVVTVTDGVSLHTEFQLADAPAVSYSDGELTIKAGDVTVQYPADKTYTFTVTDGMGVVDVRCDAHIEISADGSTLTVSSLGAGETARLYDVGGRLLYSADADPSGRLSMAIGSYTGIIIVNILGRSFKVIK